jgi:serine/threonine protein kinase
MWCITCRSREATLKECDSNRVYCRRGCQVNYYLSGKNKGEKERNYKKETKKIDEDAPRTDVVRETRQMRKVDYTVKNCINRFNAYEFDMIKVERGSQAAVLSVKKEETNELRALKVEAYPETLAFWKQRRDREIIVACFVSKLDGFVKLYDYWFCNKLPEGDEPLFKFLSKYISPNQTSLYLEMQHCEGTLAQLNRRIFWAQSAKLSFCFEFIYALNVAHKKLQFYHGDISATNILYIESDEPRQYDLDGMIVSCRQRERPMISDFGTSRISEERPTIEKFDMERLNDLALVMFGERFTVQADPPNYDNLLQLVAQRMRDTL